ncbi:AraC family transcriptional regulator [Dactylosporangium aurantiacum]|uniref:AraC family transcriptional regulator n=1 Tax=Dactylosporangium aurantiacum TaxID=35754 RepID=A0A9Q9IQW1_9ACTN|nr:helix-turn-helix domain-containing protein [Dactylosporangium aurantiacum]MDG6108453.1 helix-turn-helix domain-containing protein [Dactylosporangium aurantiacum]UWZ57358.1 AraC family transcriptional regulator [Dactylosporangium aurantiacum]
MSEHGTYVFQSDMVTVIAARWMGDPGPVQVHDWDAVELALPRQGCLSYRDRRGRALVDPTHCLLIPPLQEARTAHLTPDGVLESMLFFGRPVLEALGVDSTVVPLSAVVTPVMQVQHRRLLVAASQLADPVTLQEIAIGLLADAVAQQRPRQVAGGRPAAARVRRALVDNARALLNAEPQLDSIVVLADRLETSPHHLSRVFHEQTGSTLGEYRTRLRVNLVLDHLCADTDRRSLADIAAVCGFADHAHMTRTVRRYTGHTPSALRTTLG